MLLSWWNPTLTVLNNHLWSTFLSKLRSKSNRVVHMPAWDIGNINSDCSCLRLGGLGPAIAWIAIVFWSSNTKINKLQQYCILSHKCIEKVLEGRLHTQQRGYSYHTLREKGSWLARIGMVRQRILFYPHLQTFFFNWHWFQRERREIRIERERNIDVREGPVGCLPNAPRWDETRSPSMCPDGESNLQPLGVQGDAPANWDTPARAQRELPISQ